MTDEQILDLVQQMRAAQRRWFKNHDRADLTLSKKLESDVDKALAVRFAKQGSLL